MARYDLYQIDGRYVIDLQNDLVTIPGSRVVAPVVALDDAPIPTMGLHPQLLIGGTAYVVVMHLLAATPTALLKTPLANFTEQSDHITRGLDMLFQGY